MDGLSVRQWRAFGLVYQDGLTYEQAGEIMQISQSAVAHLIKRIRRKYPDCVPVVSHPKMLRYEGWMDEFVKEKF